MTSVAFALTSSKVEKPFLQIQSVLDIPKSLTQLTTQLLRQPLFQGYGSPRQKCKALLLPKIDARISEIFNENSRRLRKDTSPCEIRTFGTGHHQLQHEITVESIGTGLTLWLEDHFEEWNEETSFEKQVCSLEVLEDSYHQIVSQLRTGWIPTNREEPPAKDFTLFVKEKRLKEERNLIASLANKFSLENDLRCEEREKLYLWVQKSALSKVTQKLALTFAEPKGDSTPSKKG